MGARTVLPRHPDGSCWLMSVRALRLGRPDGIMGFDLSELESAQNLPWILKIALNIEVAFLQLVTFKHCHKRLFPYQRNKLWLSEDFEINDIHVKAATLHRSDFVQQNAANTKTNILPFDIL
jgi:hypothetical protein